MRKGKKKSILRVGGGKSLALVTKAVGINSPKLCWWPLPLTQLASRDIVICLSFFPHSRKGNKEKREEAKEEDEREEDGAVKGGREGERG